MPVQEADALEKKYTLWLLFGLVVFALVVGWWLHRWLGQIDTLLAGGERELARRQIDLVFGFAALLLSVSLLSLGILCGRHARDVLRQQRFPSREARLLRRMTVFEGAPAIKRGKLNAYLSAFLIMAAFVAFPYASVVSLLMG